MNVAIIPARGNSRRVPRKNCKDFRGKPMLCYPIDLAKASKLFQLIVVSTDDDEIEQVALASNAVVMRRPKDDGTKGTQEIARDVLRQLPRADFACVIYPCSPLLQVQDLYAGIHALQHSIYAMTVGPDGQDVGALYWGRAQAFRDELPLGPRTAHVRLPAERCCDVNVPADWSRAEQLYDAMKRGA